MVLETYASYPFNHLKYLVAHEFFTFNRCENYSLYINILNLLQEFINFSIT